ncbi:MAG: hypothetical protein WCP24_01910 [bacterium]
MKKFALIIIFLTLFTFKIAPALASSYIQSSAGSFIVACDYAIGTDITCPSAMASDGEDYLLIATSSASSRRVFFDLSSVPANAVIESMDIDIKSRGLVGTLTGKFTYVGNYNCNGMSRGTSRDLTFNIPSTSGSSYTYNTKHLTPSDTADGVNCGSGMTYSSWSSIATPSNWIADNSYTTGADGYPINKSDLKGSFYLTLWGSGTNFGVNIDAVDIFVNYRYDETPYLTGIKSLNLVGISGNLMYTGDDITGTYYTTATSTYNKVVLDLYDYQASTPSAGHIRLEQGATVNDTVGALYGFYDIETMGLTLNHRYTYYTRLYSPSLDKYTEAYPNNYSSFCYGTSCGTSTDYSTTTNPISTTTNPFSTTTNPFVYSTSTTSYFSTSLIYDSQTVLNARMYCDFWNYPALFDFTDCIYSLIIPESIDFSRFFSAFKDSVLTRVPFLGGFFLTTSTSLPVINATVPNGIVGTGATLSLDFNHALDWLLNSTSTKFNNVSASSTQTLFQITYPYWKIFIYFGFALYVLSRVFSSSIFGGGIGTVAKMSNKDRQNAVDVYKNYLNRKK